MPTGTPQRYFYSHIACQNYETQLFWHLSVIALKPLDLWYSNSGRINQAMLQSTIHLENILFTLFFQKTMTLKKCKILLFLTRQIYVYFSTRFKMKIAYLWHFSGVNKMKVNVCMIYWNIHIDVYQEISKNRHWMKSSVTFFIGAPCIEVSLMKKWTKNLILYFNTNTLISVSLSRSVVTTAGQ